MYLLRFTSPQDDYERFQIEVPQIDALTVAEAYNQARGEQIDARAIILDFERQSGFILTPQRTLSAFFSVVDRGNQAKPAATTAELRRWLATPETQLARAAALDDALKIAHESWAGRIRSHFDICHLADTGILGEVVMSVDIEGIVGQANMDLNQKHAVINLIRGLPISTVAKRYLFSRWMRVLGKEPTPADIDQVALWNQD